VPLLSQQEEGKEEDAVELEERRNREETASKELRRRSRAIEGYDGARDKEEDDAIDLSAFATWAISDGGRSGRPQS